MYQVAVELLEYINDKDLVNYINHDKFKHNKKNLSLRNRKKTEQEDHMMITRCRLGVWTHICFLSVNATSCPEAPFEKVECYQDNHEIRKRPLPDYLFNDLDPTTETFSGIRADWKNWDIYLPMFACRCAREAKARNATFFGVQSYGRFSSVDFYWLEASSVFSTIQFFTQSRYCRFEGKRCCKCSNWSSSCHLDSPNPFFTVIVSQVLGKTSQFFSPCASIKDEVVFGQFPNKCAFFDFFVSQTG